MLTMINYQRFKYTLKSDLAAVGINHSLKAILFNDMVKFYFYIRLLESFEKKSGLTYKFLNWRFGCVSKKLSYSIPIGCFKEGLKIPHYGTIVVNTKSKVGKNCQLNVGVVIGSDIKDKTKAPVIGDNCYIGVGAKIIGNVILGDNITIGANAVVTKSFPHGNCTLVGIPAKEKLK